MNEDIEFLKSLQEELKTQDNDGQAAPRFWVVGDYEDVVTAEGWHDSMKFYSPSQCEEYSTEVAIEMIKNNSFDNEEVQEALEDYETFGDTEKILELLQKIDDSIYEVYTAEKHVIKENTMFLTKAEAKRHIEANNYHYTPKAHTYAMTAWRSPKVARLLSILENFDWDAL